MASLPKAQPELPGLAGSIEHGPVKKAVQPWPAPAMECSAPQPPRTDAAWSAAQNRLLHVPRPLEAPGPCHKSDRCPDGRGRSPDAWDRCTARRRLPGPSRTQDRDQACSPAPPDPSGRSSFPSRLVQRLQAAAVVAAEQCQSSPVWAPDISLALPGNAQRIADCKNNRTSPCAQPCREPSADPHSSRRQDPPPSDQPPSSSTLSHFRLY